MSEKHSDDAVSEVIAFMLIFAMIVVFLASWVIFYVPSEGHNVEIKHDEEVLRQFSDIKTGVDLLWTADRKTSIDRLVSLSPTKGTDISTLLFLSPSLGSGTIKIGGGTSFSFNDTKYNEIIKINGDVHNVSLMRISYTSFNEYSDDFTIVYDGGAVFYGNTEGDQYLLGSPIMGGGKLYLVNVSSPKEEIILGNFPVSVKITYKGASDPIEVYDKKFYNVTSDYFDYWNNNILNTSVTNIQYVTILEYEIDVRVSP
ncbi:MAG: hypothetical protein Q4Q53_06805 [Methanocorpusculum sp.]|nr:hypothetical protein [Methanocorpusculum sp.]